MDADQEIKNTDKVVKQCLEHFEQQTNKTELTNTTGTLLQHMNEDCLLEIFSLKSLTPMDLCSLAETCTRFEQITQRVFPKEFTVEVSYFGGYKFKSKDYSDSKKSTRDVERIFKNFGSCLSALSFDTKFSEDDVVLKLLTKFRVGSLERLKIECMKIPEVFAIKLKPIFQQLQQLELYLVTIKGGENIFSNCDSLTELVVTEVTNDAAILENIFPKLEQLHWFDELHNSDDEPLLSIFISRHKSLKTLELITGRTDEILQTIGNNCKELEELEIDITSANENFVSELHTLDQLKQLTIWFDFRRFNATNCILQLQALKSLEILKSEGGIYVNFDKEFIPALALLTNLRELHLISRYELREHSHQLTLLTQLTKLYLDMNLAITNVVDIIRLLTNLQELTIVSYASVFCEKSFSEIVKIVKGRSHVLTLKCYFEFVYNSKNCDENQNVKLIKMRRIK